MVRVIVLLKSVILHDTYTPRRADKAITPYICAMADAGGLEQRLDDLVLICCLEIDRPVESISPCMIHTAEYSTVVSGRLDSQKIIPRKRFLMETVKPQQLRHSHGSTEK